MRTWFESPLVDLILLSVNFNWFEAFTLAAFYNVEVFSFWAFWYNCLTLFVCYSIQTYLNNIEFLKSIQAIEKRNVFQVICFWSLSLNVWHHYKLFECKSINAVYFTVINSYNRCWSSLSIKKSYFTKAITFLQNFCGLNFLPD